jgi:hypothetical protein
MTIGEDKLSFLCSGRQGDNGMRRTAKHIVDFFFEMGSIAPASASIDAHNHFIAIFKVSAVYKS